MNTREIVRDVESILTNAGITTGKPTRREIIESAVDTGPGRLLYDIGHRRDELATELAGGSEQIVRGWPECICVGCDCTDLATTSDDGGNPCCAACADYIVDDDGGVICGKHGDPKEQVAEARKQIADAGRDADGEFCVYWETVGDDSGARSRYSTAESALAACALAQDGFDASNPRSGGVTYLCGFGVRQLVDDRWEEIAE